MKKYMETYKGKEYPVREVDLSPILEGYGIECIGCNALSEAIIEDTKDLTVEDTEATEMDNSIYCYLDSGVIESDPTDPEILYAIMQLEGKSGFTDQHWYNVMRMAGHEIALMHENGRINMNCECYEYAGKYHVYAYNDDIRHHYYFGKSAETAAVVVLNMLTTIRLMLK